MRTADLPSVDRVARTLVGRPLRTASVGPAIPADLIVRDRLLALLRRGAEGPLTLVSAAAGTGKSVLVASWVARGEAPGPVAWIGVDDDEQSPSAFWSLLSQHLASCGVDMSDIAVPRRAVDVDRRLLAGLAERIGQHAEPVVVVLDTGAQAVDSARGSELDYVLRRSGTNLRLVVVTRTDPPLPLHRYRLAAGITEIRKTHLAVTSGEAGELLSSFGLDLADDQVAALLERTGGWLTGLKFAAMSLAGRVDVDQAIDEFTGDDRNVSDYLLTEVLDAQPDDVRTTLLRTSIVDQLPPGLLEALTGRPPGQRALEFWARGNAFIEPVPGSPGTYRYQSLFRQFLRAQLAYEHAELVPSLHRDAADWLAANGWLPEAVRHAVAGGGWAQAAGFLVDALAVGRLVNEESTAGLRRLVVGMPDDEPGSAAALVRAALALGHSDAARCAAELDRAEALLADDLSARAQAGRLLTAALRAHVAYAAGEVDRGLDCVSEAEQLGQCRPPSAAVPHDLVSLLGLCKARLLLWRGDLDAGQAELRAVVDATDAPGCESEQMSALGLSALVEALDGRLRRATVLAERVEALARGLGHDPSSSSVAATVARACVCADEYQLEAGHALVRHADAALGGDVMTTGVLVLVRARLLRAGGDLDGARAVLRAGRRPTPVHLLPGWLDRLLAATERAVLQAQGLDEPDGGAGEPLLDAPAALREMSTLDVQVHALLAEATEAAEQGHPTRARAALERALQLAAPERFRRPFFEASPYVRGRLGGAELADRHPWLEPAAHPVDTSGVQRLTAKEREVLGHLAHLLRTEEIAETMFVSVNTVRTHIRSILRKLGVTRRNEAVRRAWELELIPRWADDARRIDQPVRIPRPPA